MSGIQSLSHGSDVESTNPFAGMERTFPTSGIQSLPAGIEGRSGRRACAADSVSRIRSLLAGMVPKGSSALGSSVR